MGVKFKSALITGGGGFIGSHLCEHLLSLGIKVTVIDNFSTGRCENINHLRADNNFQLITDSAANRDLMEREVENHDVVYHLASAVGVKLIMKESLQSIKTIYETATSVFDACSKFSTPVVLSSTSEIYGKSTALPFSEDADIVIGATSIKRWAYACAKALDEFLMFAHFYENKLPIYIVRLFNTVGPRQSDKYGMVLPTFVRQALRGEDITVFGDGLQTRSFCSVLDVINALTLLPNTSNATGKIINIGSIEEISMAELALLVKNITGSDSIIKSIPYEDAYGPDFDDMSRRVPDITCAQDLLGWQPTRTLGEIITELVDYERKELQ